MAFNMMMHPELNIPVIVATVSGGEQDPDFLVQLILQHRPKCLKLLVEFGAILFRGFGCHDVGHFSKVVTACNLGIRCTTKDYEISRTLMADEIYTSSDLPASVFLPLHHEKPRTKNPPNHIYFCCNTPAQKGGATLFGNAAIIWDNIPESIRKNILCHGIVYRQFFHGSSIKHYFIKKALNASSARTWMDYFGTVEKSKVEERLNNEGLQWEWVNKNNDLIVLNYLPGVVPHPVTGQNLWFNSAGYLNFYSNLLYGELNSLSSSQYWMNRYLIAKDMLPIVCHYGNNIAFSSAEISQINHVIQQHTYPINWHKGDFMVVDNFTFMHGKEPHFGDRLLYGCMTQYQSNPFYF
ncbi:TauD/TfdA family dioxygenase [Legionella worsleiensis]|uniref:Regulatory protein, SyrP-like protein n=1 Tax=Legionella worsleiensis TaxID=45076 RepID=A0A0W1A695_9GAMM|nr:TauD/TfdA family dioxygenase [Legionella worsleiensis]KTD76736.1 regulatory protein, SyrP-like protein [Legionella worsleiensis]STY30527.1 regulatory protein, SyrP-like protein [Legionella worsleiensis]